MKTGPKSVFWTNFGPDFGPPLRNPSFSSREVEASFFVVEANEDLNACAFLPLLPFLIAEFTISNEAVIL